MYVFVYGTLKKNEPNHHWLTNEEHGASKFVGNGKLLTKYPLVIGSIYNIPFLLDLPGTGKEISGEVYEIDEKMLGNLDILEEYPRLYTRRLEPVSVQLESPDNAQETLLHATTYFLVKYRPEILNLPHLESYSSSGPHNLPYTASEDDLDDANDV